MKHRNLLVAVMLCAAVSTGCAANWSELGSLIRRGNSAYIVVGAKANTVKTIHAEISSTSVMVSYLAFDYDSTRISLRAYDFFFANVSPGGELVDIEIRFNAKGIRKDVVRRLITEHAMALNDEMEIADLQLRLDRSLNSLTAGDDPDVLQGMIDAIRSRRAGWYK